MKKSILTVSLILALMPAASVQASTVNDVNMPKEKRNFKEIVLGEEPSYDAPEYQVQNFIAENDKNAEDASPLERSLENKDNETTPDGATFPVFDLKGGVQKQDSDTKLDTDTTKKVEETKQSVVSEWLNGNYATGNWFGARSALEDHGVTFNSSLLYSPFGKTRGGMADQVRTGGYSLYNLSVTLDTQKMGLWKGGTFYALYQNKRGIGISRSGMGDYQIFDGWDFREMSQISEYWYQQTWKDELFRVKFGKQDANADFCYLNSGFDFLNTSFSINPTVLLPTYPDPAFGFVAAVSPKKWISLKNGIYSKFGVPFNISEIELKPTIKNMPGRYMLGAWELSDSTGMQTAVALDPANNTIYNNYNRNFGWYAGFEQMVYKEKKNDPEDRQGLTVFGQVGMSPSNRNDMSKYFGGGLHYRGPIPKRDKDIMGIGVASGNFASRLGDLANQTGSETSVECFYRAQITPWFYLQPDVQFIMNPSGMYDNSVAIGIRSVLTF